MKEVLDDIERWRAAGQRVAIARVVGIEGSGPRDPGATMAVNDAGEVAGSVSGGCVEGAVVTRRSRSSPARRSGASSPSATPTTTPSRSGSPAAARSTSSSSRWTGEPAYDELRDALRARASRSRSRPVVEGPHLGAKLLVRPDGGAVGLARRRRISTGSSPATRWASSRPASPRRATTARTARRASATSSVFIESFALAAAHDHLRRGRLHRRAGQGGQGARLPGDRVRRPRGVRHRAALPDGRRGRRRLARPLPRARSATSSARATRSACSPTTTSSTSPRSSPRCSTSVGYLGAMGSRRTHDQRGRAAARGRARPTRRSRG